MKNKKLNAIAKSIKKLKSKDHDHLFELLLDKGWKQKNYELLISPCKKFIFKANGFCYKQNKKISKLYLPTVFLKKHDTNYAIQKYCKGSDSEKTLELFRKRLIKSVKIKSFNLKKNLDLNCACCDLMEKANIRIDLHYGNVCIYKGQPHLHDW